MTTERSVAQLLTPVIARIVVLLALLAAIAIAGTLVATRSVGYLTDDLQPAAAAEKDVLQDLSDMQGAVRAYAQAGQGSALADYRSARAELPGHQDVVREFAEGDGELEALVREQDEAADAWLSDYAEPRVERPGGPGTFDRSLFLTGVQLFDEFRDAHTRTTTAFDSRVHAARASAERRLWGTVLAVLLITALAGWGVLRARRTLDAEVATPLQDLELVVQRMSGRDRHVRAGVSGPREVRAVAEALNELAEAQARARAVEQRVQDELRGLDSARDDFVSNVSHELRTPLTTINGYLELISEELEEDLTPHHQKMMEATRRNVARLRLLIDDLLTLSRTQARSTDMELVDLNAVVGDVVTDVRLTAARRGIRIETTVGDGRLDVLGDRAMLHRALLNVVSNAVKFSHDDGVVEVRATREGNHLVVVVRDHGIGIPSGEIDRLGTRFFRASNAAANQIAGTGLGVRIVQTIVDRHAGELRIDSEEGAGTTVTVRLHAQAIPTPS